jgi:hypothetical protein
MKVRMDKLEKKYTELKRAGGRAIPVTESLAVCRDRLMSQATECKVDKGREVFQEQLQCCRTKKEREETFCLTHRR